LSPVNIPAWATRGSGPAGNGNDSARSIGTAERALPSASWETFAGNPQHTAISAVASQSFDEIHWQTPVDLAPQYSGSDLLIHYGSPLVTAGNTVIVPVKTGADGAPYRALGGWKESSGAQIFLEAMFDRGLRSESILLALTAGLAR
jgi:hypothetical protein